MRMWSSRRTSSASGRAPSAPRGPQRWVTLRGAARRSSARWPPARCPPPRATASAGPRGARWRAWRTRRRPWRRTSPRSSCRRSPALCRLAPPRPAAPCGPLCRAASPRFGARAHPARSGFTPSPLRTKAQTAAPPAGRPRRCPARRGRHPPRDARARAGPAARPALRRSTRADQRARLGALPRRPRRSTRCCWLATARARTGPERRTARRGTSPRWRRSGALRCSRRVLRPPDQLCPGPCPVSARPAATWRCVRLVRGEGRDVSA